MSSVSAEIKRVPVETSVLVKGSGPSGKCVMYSTGHFYLHLAFWQLWPRAPCPMSHVPIPSPTTHTCYCQGRTELDRKKYLNRQFDICFWYIFCIIFLCCKTLNKLSTKELETSWCRAGPSSVQARLELIKVGLWFGLVWFPLVNFSLNLISSSWIQFSFKFSTVKMWV